MPLTQYSNELLTFPMVSFTKHLQIPGNHQILFSGKFGIGKTYFLSKFFNEDWQRKNFNDAKYSTINISPTNYSVSSTEDIYRYIKYDIIVSLLSQGNHLQENDLDFLGQSSLFLQNNKYSIFKKAVDIIPKIGKDIDACLNAIEEIARMLEGEKKTEGDKLVDYLELLQEDASSIFENDLVTRLIQKILIRKQDSQKTENVLVIDDLDRLDPEHIFRILNVFATHLSIEKGINKLGFDKTIVVCDIRNIKNIFGAKFGMDTDFNGYIDKFYSKEIFHFDNRNIVENIATKAFNNFKLTSRDDQEEHYQKQRLNRTPQNFCYPLLILFVRYGFINLRMLSARLSTPLHISDQDPIKFDNGRFNDRKINHPLLVHLNILKSIVGSYEEIRLLTNRLPDQYFHWSTEDLYQYCTQILKLLTYEDIGLRANPGFRSMPLNNSIFTYELTDHHEYDNILNAYKVGTEKEKYPFSKTDFRSLLNELLDLVNRIGG